MLTRNEVLRRLVLNDAEGPLSAFAVLARAARLKEKAKEELVAECVMSVLVHYGWADASLRDSVPVNECDLREALGMPAPEPDTTPIAEGWA